MKKNKSIIFISLLVLLFTFVNVYASEVGGGTIGPAGKPKVTTGTPAGSPGSSVGSTFKSPIVSGGAGSGNRTFRNIQEVGKAIIDFIIKTIVPLVVALALLTFLWGVLKFMRNSADVKEREAGRQFMLFGIIGLAVMVSVWGLVQILTNTLGQPLELPGLKQLGGSK